MPPDFGPAGSRRALDDPMIVDLAFVSPVLTPCRLLLFCLIGILRCCCHPFILLTLTPEAARRGGYTTLGANSDRT